MHASGIRALALFVRLWNELDAASLREESAVMVQAFTMTVLILADADYSRDSDDFGVLQT